VDGRWNDIAQILTCGTAHGAGTAIAPANLSRSRRAVRSDRSGTVSCTRNQAKRQNRKGSGRRSLCSEVGAIGGDSIRRLGVSSVSLRSKRNSLLESKQRKLNLSVEHGMTKGVRSPASAAQSHFLHSMVWLHSYDKAGLLIHPENGGRKHGSF